MKIQCLGSSDVLGDAGVLLEDATMCWSPWASQEGAGWEMGPMSVGFHGDLFVREP